MKSMKLINLYLILVQVFAQFGRVRNYWCSPASSPDTPLTLRAKMVGWQGSATRVSTCVTTKSKRFRTEVANLQDAEQGKITDYRTQ